MGKLRLGLSTERGSFYDPKTNAYITPSNPVQVLSYDDTTDLSGITHAVLGSRPALVLYEGELPEAEVEKYKAKYALAGMQAQARADRIAGVQRAEVTTEDNIGRGQVQENPADLITAKAVGESEELTLDFDADKANEPVEAVKAAEKVEAVEEAEAVATTSKRKGK